MKEIELCNYLRERKLLSDDLLLTFYDNSTSGKLAGSILSELKYKWYLSVFEDTLCIYQIKNFFKFGGVKEETIKRFPIKDIIFDYSETGLLTKTKYFQLKYKEVVINGVIDVELVQGVMKKIIAKSEKG